MICTFFFVVFNHSVNKYIFIREENIYTKLSRVSKYFHRRIYGVH